MLFLEDRMVKEKQPDFLSAFLPGRRGLRTWRLLLLQIPLKGPD